MGDVLEINRIDALGDYRSGWQMLLDETPGTSFFHSLEWLTVYWNQYGAGQKLKTLVVFQDGRPTGILPLVIRRERTRLGWLRVLTYPLHDWGSFYGPIGPDLGGTLSMAFAYLRSSQREWDTIDLRWVDPESTLEPVEKALQQAGYRAYRTRWDTTSVVDLHGSWENYLSGRPGKWRNCFRRWERRLKQNGRVEFLRYRPRGERYGEADPRWDLYDACEQIAAGSWQADSKTGTTLTHDSVRTFLRATHAAAARFGGLDLNLLVLDGQPTAFAYNYCHRGSVYGLRVGFDAERSRDGAGSLMCAYSIRDSFQRGDHLYDMGVGYSKTKRHLTTRQVPIYRLSHFRTLGAKAQLVRVKRWVEARQLAQEEATHQNAKRATCLPGGCFRPLPPA